MQITCQADYAARATLHLARIGKGERVPTAHIVKEEKINKNISLGVIGTQALT